MNETTQRLSTTGPPGPGPATIPTRPCPATTPPPESDPNPIGATLVNDVPPSRVFAAVPVGRFPNYEIQGEIGRGGMGVVYRARQLSLNRLVALKVMLGGPHASPADKVRFRTEAEAVARLKHPNIVQVYDVGGHEGFEYIAFELVDGDNLRRWQAGQPIDPRTAAVLVTRVAAAIQHAHDQGIVHRDLKPANILLASGVGSRASDLLAGGNGERGSSPNLSSRPETREPIDPALSPKITDFGLAKALAGGADLTVTGIACGTPNYMAPEQVRGGKAVGSAADVYGLGAVLYELLTGSPPFSGSDAADVMDRIVRTEPVPVRRLNPRVPRDLRVIVAKCLEKDPARRYPSARAVADDLDRFLAGRPILARPVSRPERVWRWCRRNPVAAAFLLIVTAGFAVTGTLAGALARSEAVERAAKSDAETARDRLEEALAAANAARATATAERAAAVQARDGLKDALKTVTAEKAAAEQERKKALDSLRLSRSVIRNTLEQFANHPRFKDEAFRELRGKLIRSAGGFAQKLTPHAGNDPEWLADLGDLSHWMGYLEFLNGNMEVAANHYLDAEGVYRRWAAADPDDPEPRFRQADALQNAGNGFNAAGKFAEAEARYRESIRLFTAVADSRPDTKLYALRMIRSHIPLYELLREQKRYPEGLTLCRETTPRARELVRRFGPHPDHLALLAGAVQVSGQMLDRTGNPAEGETMILEAMSIWERAVAGAKGAVGPTAGLSRSLFALADHCKLVKRKDQAAAALARSTGLIEEVNRVAPNVPEYELQLIDVATMQGDLYREAHDFVRAGPRLELAVKRAEDLLRRNPDPPSMRQYRTAWATAATARAHLYNMTGRHADAAAEWERLAELDPNPKVRPQHTLFVLQSRVFDKDWRKAADGAEKLETADIPAGMWIELGRIWCNVRRLVAADDSVTDEEREAVSDKAWSEALKCLERAKAAGLFRRAEFVKMFAEDRDFDPIRDKFSPKD